MKRLGCLLILVLSAAACGGGAWDAGDNSSRVFEVSIEPRTLAAGTRSFASLGGITVDLPDSSIVFVGTNCLLFQTPSDAPQMGVVIGRFDQDSNGNVVETLDDYFSMNEGAIERTDTGRTFDLFGTTLKGYSAEEVGPIEEALSCAPVGQDVDLDVTARFSGRGAQWLADAEEGGVYMAGWVSINRDFDEEASQLFDEILSTVEVTEG